jgi:hypothetical protein
MHKHWLIPSLLSICVVSASAAAQSTPAPSAEQLEQQVEQMSKQLEAMKAQLDQVRKQQDAVIQQQQAQAVAAAAAPTAGGSSPFENLSIWGYGEVYYTRPIHEPSLAQADLARAVFGIGYRFNDTTTFNSEYEVEHAVSSADDPGEFEVEQFYVDHQLTHWASIEGGLFLIPSGLLNEHHEPTAFYGVQRNFVETLIIPSTWREGGFALHGNTQFGLNWAAGLTTGLDISKWNINPENPLYRTALELEDSDAAPMQAAHQELALADANHLSQFVSMNYQGVPGLLAGGSVFTGNMTVPIQPPGLPTERVTLWELHSRWTPGKFDLSALYVHRTWCPRVSRGITRKPPTTSGSMATIASRRSCAGNAMIWRPASRASRPAFRPIRPAPPRPAAPGRSRTIASGPTVPISTLPPMSCSKPIIRASSRTAISRDSTSGSACSSKALRPESRT